MPDSDEIDDKTRIRELNDSFRRTGQGGGIVITAGIHDLSAVDQAAVFQKIRLFDAFTKANDPHEEHDFGAIEHNGEKFFFKIDYYDKNLENHSENPADPTKTTRVITVMLACEY